MHTNNFITHPQFDQIFEGQLVELRWDNGSRIGTVLGRISRSTVFGVALFTEKGMEYPIVDLDQVIRAEDPQNRVVQPDRPEDHDGPEEISAWVDCPTHLELIRAGFDTVAKCAELTKEQADDPNLFSQNEFDYSGFKNMLRHHGLEPKF